MFLKKQNFKGLIIDKLKLKQSPAQLEIQIIIIFFWSIF